MKAGRNDPCPCGSGKKFKKCCLGKQQPMAFLQGAEPALGAAGARERRAPTDMVAPRPPPPRDPAELRADACCQEFEAQDADGKIRVYLAALDDAELMTDVMAFEMLQSLHHDAVTRGQRQRFAELVQALRERRPEIYEDGGKYALAACVRDALAENRHDDLAELTTELAAMAGRDLHIVDHALEAVAYHGHLALLVEALRIAWPRVRDADDLLPWVVSEFASRGTDYEIYQYVQQTSRPDPADETLLQRLRFFVPEPDVDFLAEFLPDLAGAAHETWTVDDFILKLPPKSERDDWEDEDEDEEEPTPHDPGSHRLSRLINQFVGYLNKIEGVALPRGGLARHELYTYFLRRHAGELNPRLSMMDQLLHPKKKAPAAPKPAHPLCPDRVTLEAHLSDLVGGMNNQYHTAAALFEIVPAWLRFLERRGLIDAAQRLKTIDELRPLHASLLRLWESFTDDPTLYRAAQQWPADRVEEQIRG
jgi:hypothetical protein